MAKPKLFVEGLWDLSIASQLGLHDLNVKKTSSPGTPSIRPAHVTSIVDRHGPSVATTQMLERGEDFTHSDTQGLMIS